MRWIVLTLALLAAAVSVKPAASESAPSAWVEDPAASAWVEDGSAAVRLIAATTTTGRADTLMLALQFRLAEGWKVYWRSPGDAGYPPSVDWSGSDNLAAAHMLWPAPSRFTVLGMDTVGYEGAAVLPVRVTLARAQAPAHFRAAVDYLACADICVPHAADLTLDLPAGLPAPSAFAHLIARAESSVPTAGPLPGLDVASVNTSGRGDNLTLHVQVTADAPLQAPQVFVEGPEDYAFGAPGAPVADGPGRVRFDIPVHGAELAVAPLDGAAVTVTLLNGQHGIERHLTVGAASTAAPTDAAPGPSFALVLALGLLGGLILNLMPCVLPVLSIKLLSVIGHGGGDRRMVRLGFLASAAGILASFLVLAAAITLLKAGGAAVGWGLQFQQPWFLIVMIVVVGLFAANLWDLFEIRLPETVADAGVHAGHVHGLGGHFLTGALATLLATPCSAPFLGTAVGYALPRSGVDVFAVFIAVGLGLALPYLAVAAFPQVATRLPRPGRWMVHLRRVLGVALAATALWLVFVLAATTGLAGALLIAAAAAVAVALVVVAIRCGGRTRRAAAAGALLDAAIAVAAPAALRGGGGTDEVVSEHWQPLDRAAIAAHVAAGQVVFVNVTADWCLTCKVNERLVLAAEPVVSLLASPDVVAMQGDWTRPDDGIARYLASFGRYGIPFDAVYGPGTPNGEALPELLTPDLVIAALERAATPAR